VGVGYLRTIPAIPQRIFRKPEILASPCVCNTAFLDELPENFISGLLLFPSGFLLFQLRYL
jgi:hypothetical protein